MPLHGSELADLLHRPGWCAFRGGTRRRCPCGLGVAHAEEMRERILDGTYTSGFQLRRDALAADPGMSRIPLREAFLMLESEGLVEIFPHRGAVVAGLSSDEMEELFNVRLLLEPSLLRRSAPLPTEDDLKVLHRIQDQYAIPIDELDMKSWNKLNRYFHIS